MDPAQALECEEIERNKIINETIARGDSPIQRFYDDAVILITGGSGFLGKQMIEKLFRSCKIKKIYILLRRKQGKSLEERVKAMTNDQLYEYLHKTQPDFVKKLIPVEGDITKIQLGMTEENWKLITEEVNIIFHGAATINFVEPLKMAVLTNLRGTRETLTLANNCKKLKSFVHISTAFVHATPDRVKQPVLEQFYECSFRPDFIINLVEEMDEEKLDAITPQILGKWPNTYTFTKALAEELIRNSAGDLPLCIVRPSIVLPALREPPGWVDKSTMNGPVGFIAGGCLGGLHVMYGDHESIFDSIPVDVANNAALIAAYGTIQRRERGNSDIKIFTCCSNKILVSNGTLHKCLEEKIRGKMNTPFALWYQYVIMTSNKFMFTLLSVLLHFIPGYLVDFGLKLSGNKPKVIRLFKRAYKQNKVFAYFMTNYWLFGDSNLVEFYESLSPEDRIIFNCDVTHINVERYIMICTIGVRKYILNDGLQNTVYAGRKMFWFKILNAIYLTGYAYVIWKFISLLCVVVCAFVRIVFRL